MSSKDRAALTNTLDALERALSGTFREELVTDLGADEDVAGALGRLRGSMSEHRLGRGPHAIAFDRDVRRLDNRTRQDGFRVLHTWDHTAHRFTKDVVPVLTLDYMRRLAGPAELPRFVVALFLDDYLLHLLTLCAMRCWDAEDPDATLDRVGELLELLQGEGGSGHQFVADVETLIIYALSQFHPDEHAYDRVIARIGELRPDRQTTFALPSTAVLSAHLRWGFWLMYNRDVSRMRDDNVGDYPWLLSSVTTLARDYAAAVEGGGQPSAEVVSGLLLGLAADVWALTGSPPASLTGHLELHAELQALVDQHGARLVEDLASIQPDKASYSPLSMHFNFPHNAFIAQLVLAALKGEPATRPLNALFASSGDEEVEAVARELTAFSRATDRLGAGGAVLVAYDPYSGMRSHSMTMDALRKRVGSA